MLFEDTVWLSILTLARTQCHLISVIIFLFFFKHFYFLMFSVARSKVYWYGLGSVSLASVQSIDR